MGYRAFFSQGFGWFAALGATTFTLAVARIHVRAQTTLIGYEIGRLKANEGKTIEERSALRMQLAKVSSQKHLNQITEKLTPRPEALATK
jgi:hypothetical protein